MKVLLGILIVIFFGFLLFLACSGFGYILAITLKTFSAAEILAGTLIGSIVVVVHLLYGDNK
jgi:hypothetical protein